MEITIPAYKNAATASRPNDKMDSDLLLDTLLTLRDGPPGSHRAGLYAMWKAALCRQMSWTPENFEKRLDKAREH